ncbi:MAG: Rhomboid family protein [Solirubrobacterales bacterium]|jgi:membrane associated rhomboid family serine protease|nr:Rhomboid family protein [Solirubrobacterales bacterium]
MEKRTQQKEGLLVVAAMVALMWVLEVVDAIVNHRLDRYGIEPRSVDGLPEVVSAPFLHLGFDHLVSNTVPFAVMGAAIALGGALRVLSVTAIVGLVSGVGVWLVAPEGTTTLGASGLVFGYATYLLFRGLFNRSALEIAIGVVVGAVWGTALLGGLLPQDGISWQAHVFGAVGGIAAARLLARDRRGAASGGTLAGPRLPA